MMAMYGIGELIAILLLGSFLPSDVEPLPPEQVLRAMPDDCEFMAFQDLRGVKETITTLIDELSRQSWVTSNPEFAEGLAEVTGEMAQAEVEMTGMLGFNPFTDLHAVSICFKLDTSAGEPKPNFIALLQGDFPATTADHLGEMMGMSRHPLSNGVEVFGDREAGVIMGMFGVDGAVAFASENYLLPMTTDFPAPGIGPAAEGGLLSQLSSMAPHGITSFMAARPSTTTRLLVAGDAPMSIAKLIGGLDSIITVMNADMSYLQVSANDAESHRSYELLVGGMGDLMTAAPLAVSGMAQLLFGAISPDDPDIDDELRSLLRHRDSILSFLEEAGMMEPAQIEFNSDASTRVSSLSITGGSNSATLGILFLGGLGSFMVMGRSVSEPSYAEPIYLEPDPRYADPQEIQADDTPPPPPPQ